MAFTRKFLETMNLTDAQIGAIMEEADKLQNVQKQLDDLGGVDYKAKYESEHKALEDYKAQVRADADLEKKKAAYRKLLTEENISEKRLGAVIRLTDFSGMKLDKDGNLDGADKLRESIKTEWSDYITTTRTEREQVATPPSGAGNAKLTREDIFKRDEHGRYVLSTEERQKAIMKNPQAFQ